MDFHTEKPSSDPAIVVLFWDEPSLSLLMWVQDTKVATQSLQSSWQQIHGLAAAQASEATNPFRSQWRTVITIETSYCICVHQRVTETRIKANLPEQSWHENTALWRWRAGLHH